MTSDDRHAVPLAPEAGGSGVVSSQALLWFRQLEEAPDEVHLGERLLSLALSPEGAGARGARLYSRDRGGKGLRLAAAVGAEAAAGDAARRSTSLEVAPERLDPPASRAWRERGHAWGEAIEDVSGPRSFTGALTWRGEEGREWLMVVTCAPEDERAGQARFVALAEAARLAGRALEWRDTARRRGAQRTALAELAGAVAGARHLVEGLRNGARAALQGSGTTGAAVWRQEAGSPLRLEVTAGGFAERESLARALQPLAESVVESRRERLLEGPVADPALPPEAAARFARVACLPIAAQDRVLGALAVFDGAEVPRARAAFDVEDDEFLRAAADALAVLLEAARAAEALRSREQQVRELRARSRRRERLASLGELSSQLLQEARHPLASVAAFARRAHRELAADDPQREYLEIVIRESEKLERVLGEALDAAALESPRFRLESLNAVVQEVLPGVGERLVRRRVRLLKRLDPDAPRLLLDADRIRQVLRNVLEHAVDAVPIGGRVKVESRTVRDHAVVEIAFDARRDPGSLLEQLYVPFAPGARDAHAGPGLAVADQIVREHGGEIRVRSDADWGASVVLTIPIRANGDRRIAGSDRRQNRQDRRHRPPE